MPTNRPTSLHRAAHRRPLRLMRESVALLAVAPKEPKDDVNAPKAPPPSIGCP